MIQNPLQSPTLTRHGLVLINKPPGLTSHDVVHKARKIFQTRKIGHSGTLDPFSEGLLLLLVGEVVSLQQYFTLRSKVYRSTFKFGVTTNTLDPTGEVQNSKPDFRMPSRQIIEEKIVSGFMGDIQQIPPAYSAIKVGGRRAYALAREGKTVSLPERKVRIDQFDVLSLIENEIEVRITCSSGTYIRTLAQDLAQSLGTVGMVESLIREHVGDYSRRDAIDLDILQSEKDSRKIDDNVSFKEMHQKFPGVIPIDVLIDREDFLKGIRIHCSREEFFKAKNGNFSFSLLKRQDGIFHLIHKNTVLMIVEKRFSKTRVLFNLLKYLDL